MITKFYLGHVTFILKAVSIKVIIHKHVHVFIYANKQYVTIQIKSKYMGHNDTM